MPCDILFASKSILHKSRTWISMDFFNPLPNYPFSAQTMTVRKRRGAATK